LLNEFFDSGLIRIVCVFELVGWVYLFDLIDRLLSDNQPFLTFPSFTRRVVLGGISDRERPGSRIPYNSDRIGLLVLDCLTTSLCMRTRRTILVDNLRCSCLGALCLNSDSNH